MPFYTSFSQRLIGARANCPLTIYGSRLFLIAPGDQATT
jgi:hypothetical protein